MPKGYKLDLKEAYAIPKSKHANSTASTNKTKKANKTSEDEAESPTAANESSESNESATANKTSNETSESSGDETITDLSKKSKKKNATKELNETQIQARFDKAIDDTYSFAQAFKLNPSPHNEQHGESNSDFKLIYPAKDSHSEILPYNQRDHAYNED